jgi:hypothetical protein
MPSPVISGWLKAKTESIIWKSRFFICFDDGTVAWYTDEKEALPEGQIDLAASFIHYRSELEPRSFLLAGRIEGTAAVQLWAEEPEMAAQWVEALYSVQVSIGAVLAPQLNMVEPLGDAGREEARFEDLAAQGLLVRQPGGWFKVRDELPYLGVGPIQRYAPASKWGRQLRDEQERLINDAEFQRRKKERIATARHNIQNPRPSASMIDVQESETGRPEFVFTAAMPQPSLYRSAYPGAGAFDASPSMAARILASRGGAVPSAAISSAPAASDASVAMQERKRLEDENMKLHHELATLDGRLKQAPGATPAEYSYTSGNIDWALRDASFEEAVRKFGAEL